MQLDPLPNPIDMIINFIYEVITLFSTAYNNIVQYFLTITTLGTIAPDLPWHLIIGVIIVLPIVLILFLVSKRIRRTKEPIAPRTRSSADEVTRTIRKYRTKIAPGILIDILETETDAAYNKIQEYFSQKKIDLASKDNLVVAYQQRFAHFQKTLQPKPMSPKTEVLSEQLKKLREDAQRREKEIQALSDRLQKHDIPSIPGLTPSTTSKSKGEPSAADIKSALDEMGEPADIKKTTVGKPATSVKPKKTKPASFIPKKAADSKTTKKSKVAPTIEVVPKPSSDIRKDLQSIESSIPSFFQPTEGEELVDEMRDAIASIMKEFE